MYEITTEAQFSAAHSLKDYHGPCEQVHGHNWLVKATVQCSELNRIGIGIDFRELRQDLEGVLDKLDHTNLNEVFSEKPDVNPSSENLARYIYHRLGKAVNNDTCKLNRIEVFETPGNSASYYE